MRDWNASLYRHQGFQSLGSLLGAYEGLKPIAVGAPQLMTIGLLGAYEGLKLFSIATMSSVYSGTFIRCLWGIETVPPHPLRSLPHFRARLLGAYEGLKPFPGGVRITGPSKFIRCLWGIETDLSPHGGGDREGKFIRCLWGIETSRDREYFWEQKSGLLGAYEGLKHYKLALNTMSVKGVY